MPKADVQAYDSFKAMVLEKTGVPILGKFWNSNNFIVIILKKVIGEMEIVMVLLNWRVV